MYCVIYITISFFTLVYIKFPFDSYKNLICAEKAVYFKVQLFANMLGNRFKREKE